MALLVCLSIVRITVASRMQLVVAAVTIIVIVAIDAVVTAKGGAHGNTLAPFTFDHTEKGGPSGVFYGIILGITSYIGFESAADFGEETRNPRRSIPLAVITSVGFATVFYLWTTYSMSIGFGVDNGAAFGGDSFALQTVAARFVGAPLAVLVEIGALLSAFFVCVGCTTASTRTLFAMGREGALPPWLGRTHSRFQTPANATLTVAAIAVVLAALVGFGLGTKELGGDATTVYFFFATVGTLCVILVYIALCVGGAVYFRRTTDRYRIIPHLVVPAVGVVLFSAALYGSVYPTPPEPLDMTPYVTVVVIILGMLVLGVLRVSQPETVQRIGSIIAEEETGSAVYKAGEPGTGAAIRARP
jgi:amino acid transporter